MIGLSVIGVVFEARVGGLQCIPGFILGCGAAWLNLRLIERAVNRIIRLAGAESGKVKTGSGVAIFLQLAVFATIAFVILRFTGFNLMAAMLGFLVCPVAAVVEILYELFFYGHS